MSGLLHFSSAKAALQFERSAARGRLDQNRQDKINLAYNLYLIVCNMEALLEAGVAKDAIAEALAPLIDAISDADHSCNREIDEAGQHFDEIDLTEARALLAKVRA